MSAAASVILSRVDGEGSQNAVRRSSRSLSSLGMTIGFLLLAASALADSSATPPRLPGKVGIDQKLNAQLPLDAMFRDETGRVVRLSEYANGSKPLLLVFMYYRCPMLCSMVMEGVTSTLTELTFDAGKQYDVVSISIDPRDTPKDAAAKKEKYVKRYGRLSTAAGWHFLTGPESAIRRVTEAAGFHYAYDPQMDQFAHATALMVLTPNGRLSRYLNGFEYRPRDVRLALVEASANKIGTATDAVLLLCYHYDPVTGKYSRSAMTFIRAGGLATVAALGSFIFVMIRRDRAAAQVTRR
jgi:protein SCO1/2